jgi:hypothetical protein
VSAESTAKQVAADVRDLAVRRGWRAVEELAARILSGEAACPVLVVGGGGVESAAFLRWIGQVMDTTEIAAAGIGQIGTPQFPALFAEKLVAVFDCRRVLEAAEVNMILEHFVSRPLDSFAIVFVNAEKLESGEELDLMERAIWRVLVPGPQRDWRHQDLSAYRCYFWNASAPREFLQDRCRRDREELAALLRRPLGELDRESLDREQALRLVDLAQEHVPEPKPQTGSGLHRRREVENQIAELRRKIRRRLDAEAASLGRLITTSLLRLEQQLLHLVDETQARREMPLRLDQAILSWRTDLEAGLGQRAKEIACAIEDMLGEIDWGSEPAAQGFTISAASMPALRRPAAVVEDPWKSAIATAAAITALSLLPVSVISSLIGAGVFTASLLRREKQRSSQAGRSARQAIHDMIERAIPEMRAGIHWAVADYRNRLISGLLESETALVSASCRAELPAEPESDRDRLLSYRRRL